MEHEFKDQFKSIGSHFSRLILENGDTPDAVQWTDITTQNKRFEILCQIADLRSAKILDFGCGKADLLTYLENNENFQGQYHGIDISAEMIDFCKNKFPNSKFEARDIFENPLIESFDYILISGTFNQKTTNDLELTQKLLNCLYRSADKGLTFNALSTYVDFFDPGLNYYAPEQMFNFCKETLSPRVTLRHDYLLKENCIPYEYSIFVYSCDVPCRKNLVPVG